MLFGQPSAWPKSVPMSDRDHGITSLQRPGREEIRHNLSSIIRTDGRSEGQRILHDPRVTRSPLAFHVDREAFSPA